MHFNLNITGTNNAGDTAANMILRDSANVSGMLKIKNEDNTHLTALTMPGRNLIREEISPKLVTELIYIPMEDIRRIIHNPMVLIFSPNSLERSKVSTLKFVRRILETNDPNKGGN